MKIPEMSVIDTHLPSNTKIRGFTTEQMLAWGKACAESERDAIAQMFEAAPALVQFAQNDKGGCLICGFTPKIAIETIRARGENT
jgi:hypothetical protein